MPTYRTITLSLVSQFDLKPILEYDLPSYCPSPSIRVTDFDNEIHNETKKKAYGLIDDSSSTINVYAPALSNSQFWLNFKATKPAFPTEYYFFKFFVDGKHFNSWGIGEESDWSGKMVFGLFVNGHDQIERRNLSFGSADVSGVIEVKVFRCFGRKRIRTRLDHLVEDGCGSRRKPTRRENHPEKAQDELVGLLKRKEQDTRGIRFTYGGVLKTHYHHPLRYYKYELIDAVTNPFATFRYFFRSWGTYMNTPKPTAPADSSSLATLCSQDRLDAFGVIKPPDSEYTESASDSYSSYSNLPSPRDLLDSPIQHQSICPGKRTPTQPLNGRLSRLSLRDGDGITTGPETSTPTLPAVFPPPHVLLPPPETLVSAFLQRHPCITLSPTPAFGGGETPHSIKYAPQRASSASSTTSVPPRGKKRMGFLRGIVAMARTRIGDHNTAVQGMAVD